MGLRSWWRENREKAEATRRSLALNSDQELIAQQVPELIGMSDVEGMAYVVQQIQEWNKTCSKEQAATFARRLIASNESFKADGLTMPYWGNLWVLRTYQTELGFDVPQVAPPALDPYKQGEAFGKSAGAALDVFIASEIVPRRNAFIEVFKDQLARLDERLAEMDPGGKYTREELAKMDYQILLQNWRERRPEQMDQATKALGDQLAQADLIDCGSDLRAAIEQALNEQESILVNDGLVVLLDAAGS
jgi:hypothetical protein